MSSFETPRPRTSDEEDEEEEVEFKLTEKKEEKPWFSLNKCIVGALILLFLGSLFLSGEFLSHLTKPAFHLQIEEEPLLFFTITVCSSFRNEQNNNFRGYCEYCHKNIVHLLI